MTVTPSATKPETIYSAYIFAEPQDSTSQNDLGTYMFDGTATWFGYTNNGGIPGAAQYSYTMDRYAHFSSFSAGTGNFSVSPTTLSAPICQDVAGCTDSFGKSVVQYGFGNIEVSTSDVNTSVRYFYSIWIPLAGVNNSLSNLQVDIGTGAADANNLGNDLNPDSLINTDVTVSSGAVIPSGTYRVLWLDPNARIPGSLPLSQNIYFKGVSYTS
jgi:hypothetical protein